MNVESARKVTEFARIAQRDKDGRARVVWVPGHEGRRYQVILRREAGGITTECRLDCGAAGFKDCPGNSRNGCCCYHSLAAAAKAAEDAGYKMIWCAGGKKDARRLANLGGRPICLKSRQGCGVAWGIIRTK